MVFTSEQGVPVTTSLIVAKVFGKEHYNVLKAVRNLLTSSQKLLLAENEELSQMFQLVEHDVPIAQGGFKKQPVYIMNRKGFSLLALKFNSPMALKFQLNYVTAFDKMETALKEIILNKNKELMEINKKQEEQLLKQAPIIKEHKIFMESETLYTTTEVAMNLLNTSAEKVHDILLARGVIKRHSEGHYMLTVKYSGKGYGVIVEKPVKIGRKIQIKKTLKWTNKGRGLIYSIMHSVNMYQPQLGIWSEEVMNSLVVNN